MVVVTRRCHNVAILFAFLKVGERYGDVSATKSLRGRRTVSGRRGYFDIDFGFTVKNASCGSGSRRAIAPERR